MDLLTVRAAQGTARSHRWLPLSGPRNGIPAHLRDAHYPGSKQLGHGKGYKYAHDAPHAVATQQYPPDDLVGRNYYEPTGNGAERDIATRLERLRKIIRGK